MDKIILHGEITKDGRLQVELPPNLPAGKVTIEINTEAEIPGNELNEVQGVTLGELLDSGLAGLWADRTDIEDTVEYARQLRQRAFSPRYE
ncbi:MAG: hypothetical protein U0694_06900 [Anaerolineae bacterium]